MQRQASEAFYLTEAGNEARRGELRFRLALRGAYWADVHDRRRVFDTLKKGYDLRSKVVHGSDLNSAKDPKTAQAIVDDVEETLRVALLKALKTIEAPAGQYPVPWDALVLDLGQSDTPQRGHVASEVRP